MSARAWLVRLAGAFFALATTAVEAGGPLSVCNFAPLKYAGTGTVILNYDMGNLGNRTKSQADAIVDSARLLWNNVGTSSVVIGHGQDMPVDVTAANYLSYIYNNTDKLNPVIYDTDGSIIDLYFGAGSKNSVLGFAGSAYSLAPICQYAEGRVVISGFLTNISDTTMSVVVAHEIGHLIGLDHTQLDSTQGLVSTNYPLMYPIVGRTTLSLHEDDVAAVSVLYPDPTLSSVYGQISGTLVLADGTTPVKGANIWATETTTNKVYSIVSDYLTQNTGFFKLLLPAGTYNLRAEAIQSAFNGGSSVGPYAETSADPSFQPPLYVNGVPMAIVTLGNGTPTSFGINAGCTATLTFRINGTGAVTGNCIVSPGPPVIGVATPGNAQALVAFTAPASDGGSPITGYTATCNPGGLQGTAAFSPITVPGFLNNTPYTCSVTAANISGAGLASATVGVTPSSAAPPALIGVLSRKFHNGPTPYDVPIDTNVMSITGLISVEPRTIGSGHTIWFQFNNAISSPGTVNVVDGNNVTVAATPTLSGNNVIVTIPSLADNKRITISLSNVMGPNGTVTPQPVSMCFLVGDFNSSHSVNASDISAVKAQSGVLLSPSNFKFDVNASGSITPADVAAVKARAGVVLP